MIKKAITIMIVASLSLAGYAAASGSFRIIKLHRGESVRIGNVKVVDVSKPVVITKTVTVTTTTKATPPPAAVFDFSGNGDGNLAPFTTSVGETLTWTYENTNGDFPTGIYISDHAAASTLVWTTDAVPVNGTTYLPPGTHSLKVITIGYWTIHVGP